MEPLDDPKRVVDKKKKKSIKKVHRRMPRPT